MGSKAFVVACADIVIPFQLFSCLRGETKPERLEPDRIEFYKHTHFIKEKGWSSQETEYHYARILIFFSNIYCTLYKSGYIKGTDYGPKPNTIRAKERRIV
ncbi:hypothetical protein R3W88_007964 [Solanum pinnatisectum]|uniref:Uncharacterized protein n=1 Tax=Solanum pinnatisectum TaxID=50273 RepID=A0AAV9M6I0_9SOLN|nr:hypothetical protein R3W88_007964 [Solanum pinnatisectum]